MHRYGEHPRRLHVSALAAAANPSYSRIDTWNLLDDACRELAELDRCGLDTSHATARVRRLLNRLGAYERLPMFERIEADGVRWSDGRSERVDAILWATGFRPAVDHLAPLGLRSAEGGIPLVPVRGNVQGATTAARDPRVQLVGYGPSASTIGAPRAGRQAALAVSRQLAAARTELSA